MHNQCGADGVVVEVGYGAGGAVVPAGSDGCLAKEVVDGSTGTTHWMVKKGTFGAEAGRMYNPHSPTFEPGAGGVDQRTGRSPYAFARVGRPAFEAYLRFLRTGNTLHLRHAERE